MPKRNRAREARREADRAAGVVTPSKPTSNKNKAKAKKRAKPKRTGPKSKPDPSDTPDTVVHYVMSGDSVRAYLCPGCQREIPAGLSHVVAVPAEVDLRRHWHRACWENRRPRR